MMPYDIVRQNEQWCVVKEDDGAVMGCHASEDDAISQIMALYASESTKVAERYSDIDFSPTDAMRDAARRALEVRSDKPESERGMTSVGIARARDIINADALSPETWERMLSYFQRHEVDKQGESWDEQGKGWQAWNGWGGDAGFSRARSIVSQMETADKESAKGAKADAMLRGVVVYQHNAIKAQPEGVIEGYIVYYGDKRKDKDRQYFAPNTRYFLHWNDKWPVFYHHTLEQSRPIEIGYIYSIVETEKGLYAKAKLLLDSNDATVKRLAEKTFYEAKQGLLHWSSDSVGHLARVERDGLITDWPIVGASVTSRPAANHGVTRIEATKSQKPTERKAKEVIRVNGGERIQLNLALKGKDIMEMTALLAALANVADLSADQKLAILEALGQTANAEIETETPAAPEPTMMEAREVEEEEKGYNGKELDEMKAQIKTIADMITASREAKAVKQEAPRKPAQSQLPAAKSAPVQVEVGDNYPDLDAADMALAHIVLSAKNSPSHRELPESFYREMAAKAAKMSDGGKLPLDGHMRSAVKAIADGSRSAMKTADMMNTAEADYGGDWIPTIWGNTLWEKARIATTVFPAIPNFPMPSVTFEYPLESTDPTVYSVAQADTVASHLGIAEATAFTKSRAVTDKATYNAKKIGLQVAFSAEQALASIVPFIQELRAICESTMYEAIDNVLLNADATTGTGNINYSGGNTSAVPTAKFLYGGGDGFRHLPLVDNTALAVNASGGNPTLALIRQARRKLNAAYGIRTADLAIWCDTSTYYKLLALDEILDASINGVGSSVATGQVKAIDGIPVYPTDQLSLTLSTGFVSSTPASNTLGNIVLVYRPAWKVGIFRQMNAYVEYFPSNDAHTLTMHATMALKSRDTSSAALIYNINVD